jgi:hypothetical protein
MMAAANKLPASGLKFDTQQAAAGNTGDGLGYIGVWATDAAGCAKVDQAGASGYVVITGATFRNGANACFGNFGAIADGKGTLQVGCADGTNKSVAIAQSAPAALTIDGTAYVRCEP